MEPRWMLKQVEGSPTPPRMLLLDCLHDSTFTAARREALTQALATIHRIMENILGRDAGAQEDKFCRVRMISATWRERVDPVFYRLRVLEWMSFCMDDDGVFAVFTPSLAQCCDIESEKHFVRYRLVEVAVMQAAVTGAGAVPPSSSSNIAVSTAPGWMNEVDHAMRHACDDEASCVLKRGMRALVLLFWSSKLPESGELHWLVGRLQRECAVAQEVGPLPVACLSVTLSQLEDTLTSFTPHTSSEGLRGTTSAFIRAHVAARHRRAWEAEKVEELQADTGDAFRSLSREEQLVGTSLIADIAGLMHQVSVVLDTQGMIREDRMEAHRLLHKFHRDGDVLKLHGLKDEWEARLESAKVSSGRTCVFLAE